MISFFFLLNQSLSFLLKAPIITKPLPIEAKKAELYIKKLSSFFSKNAPKTTPKEIPKITQPESMNEKDLKLKFTIKTHISNQIQLNLHCLLSYQN